MPRPIDPFRTHRLSQKIVSACRIGTSLFHLAHVAEPAIRATAKPLGGGTGLTCGSYGTQAEPRACDIQEDQLYEHRQKLGKDYLLTPSAKTGTMEV
jgi:hypothetical protein